MTGKSPKPYYIVTDPNILLALLIKTQVNFIIRRNQACTENNLGAWKSFGLDFFHNSHSVLLLLSDSGLRWRSVDHGVRGNSRQRAASPHGHGTGLIEIFLQGNHPGRWNTGRTDDIETCRRKRWDDRSVSGFTSIVFLGIIWGWIDHLSVCPISLIQGPAGSCGVGLCTQETLTKLTWSTRDPLVA